jgi:signal peptidase I
VIGIVLISLFIVAFVQQQALKDSVEILLASQALSALVVAAVCYHSFIAASGSATGRRRTLLKLTCAIAVAGILKFTFIYGFKRFLYEPYLVPTLSMESTLKRGDRVIVAHFHHGHVGERGDIIAYKVPGNQYQTHMSRLVGFGGDEIEIVGGKIQVNGNLLSGGPFDRIKYAPSDYNPESKFQVPPDSVFVLGDNVPNSKDSRYVGPIPARNVVGKVYKVYWPLARSGSTE